MGGTKPTLRMLIEAELQRAQKKPVSMRTMVNRIARKVENG